MNTLFCYPLILLHITPSRGCPHRTHKHIMILTTLNYVHLSVHSEHIHKLMESVYVT